MAFTIWARRSLGSSVFPWAAFAFAGLAAIPPAKSSPAFAGNLGLPLAGRVPGLILIELSRWLDAQPRQPYPVYDYGHTSPNFFLIRCGMLLVILTGKICLVPLGIRSAWIQPADPSWPGFVARLLGPHRICLWMCFSSFLSESRESPSPRSDFSSRITLAMLALAYFLHPHRKVNSSQHGKKPEPLNFSRNYLPDRIRKERESRAETLGKDEPLRDPPRPLW